MARRVFRVAVAVRVYFRFMNNETDGNPSTFGSLLFDAIGIRPPTNTFIIIIMSPMSILTMCTSR